MSHSPLTRGLQTQGNPAGRTSAPVSPSNRLKNAALLAVLLLFALAVSLLFRAALTTASENNAADTVMLIGP